MTEEKFIELFGENENLYIKISDLKQILVKPRNELVYDLIISKKNEIWEGQEKTYETTLRAFKKVFGKGWEDKITFSDLVRDFKKLTYLKGVGKVTLRYVVKICKINGNRITPEMYKYSDLC